MNNRLMHQATVIFSVLALLLVVTNGIMLNKSRGLQEDLQKRGAQINAGATFSQVFQGLVETLAQIAVKQKDNEVRQLLVANGFTFTDDKPQQQTNQAPEKPAAKKK